MRRLRRLRRLRLLLLAPVLLLATTTPVLAAPQEQGGCRTHTWTSEDSGKTPNGWTAEATDGCHRVTWTSSIGQAPCEGRVTFAVTKNVDPWAGDLPNTGDYCEMRAAHEANLHFLNLFKVAPGTLVTVWYSGD